MSTVEIRHFHLFCGLGGGAAGFNLGAARVGQATARFRCLGGVDVDPAGVADFRRLAGVPATHLDMFDRAQFLAFHGRPPPDGWHEATPDDIRRSAGGERPHIVFTSPPCKGFSGLLSQQRSGSARYQALNALTLRGVWLMLEAWADDPPEFVLLENVPRITSRGRSLLDRIEALLQRYGYATAETVHDCGELGGLAQSRRRFLLVARHREKVPPFLYEPQRRPLRAVGEVLEALPLAGDTDAGGPMHRLPSLQWRTWLRLAFVEAGSDWRSLERLRVERGVLVDYGIAPETEWQDGVLGVRRWDAPTGTVTGRSGPTNGAFAVADPRWEGSHEYGQLGVRRWGEPTGAVSGQSAPGGGRYSVADPRLGCDASDRERRRFNNVYRVVRWADAGPAVTGGGAPSAGGVTVADPRLPENAGRHRNLWRVVPWTSSAGTVIGATRPGSGALSVADPRRQSHERWSGGKYRVTPFEAPAGTVIAASTTGNGAFAVADPRTGWGARAHYQTAGHYGVVPWDRPAYAVTGKAKHDTGRWNVADPRDHALDAGLDLPAVTDRGAWVIRALDGTWHRPFTTLELAALQGLVDPETHRLELEGASDSGWRERIGNAVPAPAAAAIAGVMGRTLLLAWAGETFVLDAMPVWVRPVAVAAAIDRPDQEPGR